MSTAKVWYSTDALELNLIDKISIFKTSFEYAFLINLRREKVFEILGTVP